MNRTIRSRRLGRIVPLLSLLFLVQLLENGSGQTAHPDDIVFPPVIDLAIGDPCIVQPSPTSDISYARDGICQRVRECATFVPRIILEAFDIRRDVCYFEVHDPVVCCIQEPVPTSKLEAKIMSGQRARPIVPVQSQPRQRVEPATAGILRQPA